MPFSFMYSMKNDPLYRDFSFMEICFEINALKELNNCTLFL